jgi:hypothetical protein
MGVHDVASSIVTDGCTVWRVALPTGDMSATDTAMHWQPLKHHLHAAAGHRRHHHHPIGTLPTLTLRHQEKFLSSVLQQGGHTCSTVFPHIQPSILDKVRMYIRRGSMFLQNVATYLPDSMLSHPRDSKLHCNTSFSVINITKISAVQNIFARNIWVRVRWLLHVLSALIFRSPACYPQITLTCFIWFWE